ncbi:MAG: glycosyltransferase family 4 protein [Caldilinea sp.]|jgi:glycosyltransferase involved in cell wall biosynthesis
MRVLHVTQRYLPAIGGSELHLAELSTRLVADGHQVTVVTTDALDFELFWNPRARRVAQAESWIQGVRVLRFPVRHLPFSPLSYPALRRLIWLLASARSIPLVWLQRIARLTPWVPDLQLWLDQTGERFDLVAAMTIVFEPLVAAAQRYARRSATPFVVYPLTHLGTGNVAGSDPNSRFYTMRHQRDLVLHSDFLIANSPDESAFYRAQGMAAERMAAVGPGIEPEDLRGGDGGRLRSRCGLQGAVVGVLSALSYDKGAVHVVEAVRLLWQAGVAVELLLAGVVLEPFQRYLERLPAGDRRRLTVLGPVDHQTKLDFLDAIDVLALPSRTDSFGIVYLEAWSYGKPVVGAQAWGVRSVIDDGQNGLLVPFGEVSVLAAVLRRLLEDPDLRQRLGEHGRRTVFSMHTWAHKYPRVLEIYHQLVKTKEEAV